MKIEKLKINGFGNLENKDISLSEGINLIYGNNEAGKTTLLKFISSMFFGASKNKNKKEFSDFERYQPWNTNDFSGKLNYKLDNGEEYEIFRDFTKKNPHIYKDGEDISKNFNIDKTKGNEFFFNQTKIDEPLLFSTSLVEQTKTSLDENEQTILTQKITNLMSTGDENLSYKKTISMLDKKLKEEVGTERTVGKPLNVINEKIKKMNEEKSKIDFSKQTIDELEEKNTKIKKQIEEKSAKIDLVKKIKEVLHEDNLFEEKINAHNNILDGEEIKQKNLKDKITSDENVKQKNKKINLILIIFLIIINLILLFLNINKIINLIIFIISIITILLINKLNKKNKNKNNLSEINLIKNNIEKINNNIKEIKNEREKNLNNKKELIKNNFANKIDKDEIDDLFNEPKNEIYNIEENLSNELQSLKLQLYSNEIDYKNMNNLSERKIQLEEQLDNYIEEKNEILEYGECINLAIEALENAYTKMKKEITPQYTKELSNIVNRISDGKYSNVQYIDGKGLVVELENGEYINANKLSQGTIDELYLSLRLSAMKEITEEKIPIILDESFAYFDNFRLENILNYLNKNLNNYQIIILSCSDREKIIMEKNGINFNYIKLT